MDLKKHIKIIYWLWIYFLFFFVFFFSFFYFPLYFLFLTFPSNFFLGIKLIVQTISEPFPFKKKHTHKWKCQIDVIFTIFNKWGLLFQIWRCNTLAQIFLNLFQEKFGNKLLNLYRPIKNWIVYSLTILDTKFRNEVWCRKYCSCSPCNYPGLTNMWSNYKQMREGGRAQERAGKDKNSCTNYKNSWKKIQKFIIYSNI